MSTKIGNIKLSKWLQLSISNELPYKNELILIIETIVQATIPIRGLLEKGITSREIGFRMKIKEPKEEINIYDEVQIHEDTLTHSIILKAIQDAGISYDFIASEEAKPELGEGNFGITIDPVDGSSNVAVNRTVGTIVGIYYKGNIICSFYVLYGVFTNLVISIENKVIEFILDNTPYNLTFYHYVFHRYIAMPDIETGGIRCLGGDSTQWSEKCNRYERNLIEHHFKDRYSGSFVGDFHAVAHYGGVYGYFLQKDKAKIRLYYEWLPLAFIVKSLGGEFLMIGKDDKIEFMSNVVLLTKNTLLKIHATICGGLIGNKKAVNLFLTS